MLVIIGLVGLLIGFIFGYAACAYEYNIKRR